MVCSCEFVPNRVLIVVAVRFTDVPITALDTLVPKVVVEFKVEAAAVLIPTPLKVASTLASAIVATYPPASKVFVDPK